MHARRIRAVEPDHIGRDALTEIGLDGVHSLLKEMLDVLFEPLASVRISEIHQPHAGLPKIGLPYVSIGLANQVALVCSLVKEGAFLPDIRIDPGADMQPLLAVEASQGPLYIREEASIPLEVGPVEFPHPIAVVVKNAQGNMPSSHAIDHGCHGLLVIFRGEGCGQPETV